MRRTIFMASPLIKKIMNRSFITLGKRGLWSSAAVALLVLAATIATGLTYERRRIVDLEFQRLASQTKVIEDNINRQLDGVDSALLSVRRDWDRLNPPGDSERTLLNLRLQALSDSLPGVRTMNVLNADGDMVASNMHELIGQNFAHREYFTTAKQQRDPNRPYLSQPFKSALGVYSSSLVRISTDASGDVQRSYVATLDPEFFSVLLSSVRFEDDVWVSLAHTGGRLLLRYPDIPGLLGQDLRKPGSFFSRHMDSGELSTVLTGHVATTGAPAWMAQRTIAAQSIAMKGGFVVAVARTPATALGTWTDVAIAGATFWVLMACASLSLLWLLDKHQDEANRRLADAEQLRHQAEEQIRHMAFYDALTELPNRRLLYDRMTQVMAAGKRHDRYSALLFVDLDGFKKLNDTHGHERGDRLLQAVARRLESEVRQEDTAARLGGDEFVVMLSELSSSLDDARQKAAAVAQKMLDSLSKVYDLDGLQFSCTASIGVAIFGPSDESMDAIVNRADDAMYAAKSSGHNSFRL